MTFFVHPRGTPLSFFLTRSGLILCGAYFYKKALAITVSRLLTYMSAHRSTSLGVLPPSVDLGG